MINIGYRTSRIQGNTIRSIYRKLLPYIVRFPLKQTAKVAMSVYAFSCERDLPEQVASIRSFINYAGIPDRFTVISDGSYTQASQNLLRQINPCVDIIHWESLIAKWIPKPILDYANHHPMGKKLASIMSLPVDQAIIYSDSDILFFPKAREMKYLCNSQALYLPDCCCALDKRFLFGEEHKYPHVNAGFLFFNKTLNWDLVIERMRQVKEVPNYFTEQTMVYLTMHNNQATPLDPSQYILSLDDQFVYRDKYDSSRIILRHYVNPVRHRFWLNVNLNEFIDFKK